MANYWAIAIGINQYRFLPPLSYAQRDAELLHAFLIQAGLAPRHCSLLSDYITVTRSDPQFPTAQNIQARIAQYQQVVKPGDVVLCFFSGYGLQIQGQDYLLPIEADPQQVATTAIAIESLLKALKAIPTPNLVLMLDANRSQLNLEQANFGAQTVQLAQAYNIATLLSCQPDQFSHEPLTLRQGIFTAALVAALQDEGCMTLEQLVDSVSQRLPHLSEQCWRPRQDLLAVVPSNLKYQLILPDAAGRKRETTDRLVGAIASEANSAERVKIMLSQFSSLARASSNFVQSVKGWMTPASQNLPSAMATEIGAIATSTLEPSEVATDPSALTDEFFWRRLLAQGGLIAGILLFGVILRNSSALINASKQIDRSPVPSSELPSVSAASPLASGSTPVAIGEPTVAVDPALLLQSAQAAFQAQQYEDANRQLAQISAAQRNPEQNQLLEQTNRELLNQAKTMLIRTREPRAENQVSDFVEAIKIARLIKSDQPLYQEAQQNIDRWSRVIMDMAQGRAERSNGESPIDAANNYSRAISAAHLVPDDQTQIQNQAQQAILLWSQKILDLANDRAANGNLDLAIQIGELVPPNTAVYASAQEAIANWRNLPAPAAESTIGKAPTEPEKPR